MFVVIDDPMMLFLKKEYFINPFFELVDVFILSLSHGLVPMIGFAFDSLPDVPQLHSCYRFVSLGIDFIDNLGVWYSLN